MYNNNYLEENLWKYLHALGVCGSGMCWEWVSYARQETQKKKGNEETFDYVNILNTTKRQ